MGKNRVKNISIRPTQKIQDALDEYVKSYGGSRNSVIMLALEQFLNQKESTKKLADPHIYHGSN